MSKFDPAVTLPQTIDFITEVQALVAGISLDQLLADPIKLRAFEQVMELVGGLEIPLQIARSLQFWKNNLTSDIIDIILLKL